MWVEGSYNYADPSNPVSYHLRSELINWDPIGADSIHYRIQRNEIWDVDGRAHIFWKMERVNYRYTYTGLIGFNVYMFFFEAENYIRYTQYYIYSISSNRRRTLETGIDKTTEVEKVDEVTDSMVIKIFFIISQVGGLYSFLIMALGLVMFPFIQKLYLHSAVNKLRSINSQRLKEIKQKEYQILQDQDVLIDFDGGLYEEICQSYAYKDLFYDFF